MLILTIGKKNLASEQLYGVPLHIAVLLPKKDQDLMMDAALSDGSITKKQGGIQIKKVVRCLLLKLIEAHSGCIEDSYWRELRILYVASI